MVKTKTAIVILSFNTRKLLGQCLRSLWDGGVGKVAARIIVVDNGSADDSVRVVENLKSQSRRGGTNLRLIENKKNLGFAAGNNIGVKQAIADGAEYVMVLNSDTRVDENFLWPLIRSLEDNHRIGVVAPKIYFSPGCEFHKDRYKKEEQGKVIWSVGGIIDWENVIASNRGVDEVDRGQYEQGEEVDFVSGCCFMASAQVWEKVNFFEEKYFLYYEDTDFCQKVKKLGLKIIYSPKSKVWHVNAASSRSGGPLHDYFITRNRLLFGMRWASCRAKLALIKESLALLRKGRQWQKIGVKDFYLQRFGRGSWK